MLAKTGPNGDPIATPLTDLVIILPIEYEVAFLRRELKQISEDFIFFIFVCNHCLFSLEIEMAEKQGFL